MAESSLSLGYPELLRAVGRFLGYGADSSGWDADQLSEVEDHINAGLRRFYGAYQWSFLRPTYDLATVAAQAAYTLPDNFAAVIGDITFAANAQILWSVRMVPDLTMRRTRAYGVHSGKPEIASVAPLLTDGATGQRSQLTFWPTPDAIYTVSFSMQLIPNAVTAANPYPLGGELYAEAIRACCMAAAEADMDDQQKVQAERAAEQVALAVATDKLHRSITTYGYNGDNSDTQMPFKRTSLRTVTYHGA